METDVKSYYAALRMRAILEPQEEETHDHDSGAGEFEYDFDDDFGISPVKSYYSADQMRAMLKEKEEKTLDKSNSEDGVGAGEFEYDFDDDFGLSPVKSYYSADQMRAMLKEKEEDALDKSDSEDDDEPHITKVIHHIPTPYTDDSYNYVFNPNLNDSEPPIVKACRFLCGACNDGIYGWLLLSPVDSTLTLREIDEMNHPSILGLLAFGSVICKSKLYIVGGYKRGWGYDHYKTVHVYDINSKTWSQIHPMQSGRSFPTVAAVDDKIFVFGHMNFYAADDYRLNSDQFGECFDTAQGSWKYLSKAPKNLVRIRITYSHAIYEAGKQIFFSVRGAGIYSYNYDSGHWLCFENDHLPIDICREWSDTVAVIGHYVFWHFCGSMYVFDILNNIYAPLYDITKEKSPHKPNIFFDTDTTSFVSTMGHKGISLIFVDMSGVIWSYIFQLTEGGEEMGVGLVLIEKRFTKSDHRICDMETSLIAS